MSSKTLELRARQSMLGLGATEFYRRLDVLYNLPKGKKPTDLNLAKYIYSSRSISERLTHIFFKKFFNKTYVRKFLNALKTFRRMQRFQMKKFQKPNRPRTIFVSTVRPFKKNARNFYENKTVS